MYKDRQIGNKSIMGQQGPKSPIQGRFGLNGPKSAERGLAPIFMVP